MCEVAGKNFITKRLVLMTQKTTQLLDNIAEVSASYPFRSRVEDSPDGTLYVLQVQNITAANEILWDETVLTEDFPSAEKYLVSHGDILFMLRGPGYRAIYLNKVEERAVASTQFFQIRVTDPSIILPEFLAWQMNQAPVKQYIESMEFGSTIRTIRIADLKRMPIVIPSIERQNELISLGFSINRKNTLLMKLMELNLEFMASVAFKEVSPNTL
ncbi:hypothetical protein C4J81_01960 [Deltaproteobacteria bacterium Smac51]|nr:hypothetical protein C4J81_01960 [Deltaproteobacteria bacterium Smac51]